MLIILGNYLIIRYRKYVIVNICPGISYCFPDIARDITGINNHVNRCL